jgi:hypothetical protein
VRVYVAGPYTGADPLEVSANVARAMDAGIALIALGHNPYIPHLTHFLELRNAEFALDHGLRLTYEDYMRIDQEWLGCCEALLYIGPSPGADRELAYARQLGLKVYFTVEEVEELE